MNRDHSTNLYTLVTDFIGAAPFCARFKLNSAETFVSLILFHIDGAAPSKTTVHLRIKTPITTFEESFSKNDPVPEEGKIGETLRFTIAWN